MQPNWKISVAPDATELALVLVWAAPMAKLSRDPLASTFASEVDLLELHWQSNPFHCPVAASNYEFATPTTNYMRKTRTPLPRRYFINGDAREQCLRK